MGAGTPISCESSWTAVAVTASWRSSISGGRASTAHRSCMDKSQAPLSRSIVAPSATCLAREQSPASRRYGGAAHHSAISRELLARMAGLGPAAKAPPWTLVGADSLGSKLALHLAWAGNGPSAIVDKSVMAPHNAARHALVPATGELQIFWTDAKARMLAQAMQGLNQTATPIQTDATRMLISGEDTRHAWSKKSWAVVNATASPVVREAFGANSALPARVVETSLFAGDISSVVSGALDDLVDEIPDAGRVVEAWQQRRLSKSGTLQTVRPQGGASGVKIASGKSHGTIWGKTVGGLEDIPVFRSPKVPRYYPPSFRYYPNHAGTVWQGRKQKKLCRHGRNLRDGLRHRGQALRQGSEGDPPDLSGPGAG